MEQELKLIAEDGVLVARYNPPFAGKSGELLLYSVRPMAWILGRRGHPLISLYNKDDPDAWFTVDCQRSVAEDLLEEWRQHRLEIGEPLGRKAYGAWAIKRSGL